VRLGLLLPHARYWGSNSRICPPSPPPPPLIRPRFNSHLCSLCGGFLWFPFLRWVWFGFSFDCSFFFFLLVHVSFPRVIGLVLRPWGLLSLLLLKVFEAAFRFFPFVFFFLFSPWVAHHRPLLAPNRGIDGSFFSPTSFFLFPCEADPFRR